MTVWQIWVKGKAGKGAYPEGEGFGGMHFPIQLSGAGSHRTPWSRGCSSGVLKAPGSTGGAVNASRRLLRVWKKATGAAHIFHKTKSQPSITATLRRLEPICDPPTSRSATVWEQQCWCTSCLLNRALILVQRLGGVCCFLLCKYLFESELRRFVWNKRKAAPICWDEGKEYKRSNRKSLYSSSKCKKHPLPEERSIFTGNQQVFSKIQVATTVSIILVWISKWI